MSGIVASLLAELVVAPMVPPRAAEAGAAGAAAAGESFAGALVQAMTPSVTGPVVAEHEAVPASSGAAMPMKESPFPVSGIGGSASGVEFSVNDVEAAVKDAASSLKDVVTPVSDVVTPESDAAAPVRDVAPPVKGVALPMHDAAPPMNEGIAPSPDLRTAGGDVAPPVSEAVPAGRGAARAHHVQLQTEPRAKPAESSAPAAPDPVEVADVAAPVDVREPEAPAIAEPRRRGWADEDAWETARVVRDPVAGAVQLLFAALAPVAAKREAAPAETQAPPVQPQQTPLPRIRVAGRSIATAAGPAGEPGSAEEGAAPDGFADDVLDTGAPVATAAETAPAKVTVAGDRLAELAGGAERVEVVLARRTPEPAPRSAPPAEAAPGTEEPAAPEREPAPALESAAAAPMPEVAIGATPSGRPEAGLSTAGSGTPHRSDGPAAMRAPDPGPLQAAPRGFDQVTVQLGEELGGGSLRVAVRNGVVRARIVSGDEQVARSLEHGLGELQSTLAKQGFGDARVSVLGTAAAGHAAESGAQGDTRQERHDGQARREGEDAPRHDRQGRQERHERHERHERQQRARNGWRAWLDGND